MEYKNATALKQWDERANDCHWISELTAKKNHQVPNKVLFIFLEL